jgi:RNA polymerase sigma factor (sigma-70 family)
MNHRSEERRLRAYARAAAALSGYEPAVAVEDRLDAEALGPALALALAGLSPALREVLVLHAWAELSNEEIAEALGCSSAVVRTRLSRARSQLATGLGVPITTEAEER